MSELEITISNITTNIKIKDPADKELYLSAAKNLNLEYNSACIEVGQNIDKTILLFFLLLKLELNKNNNLSPIVTILNLLKKISKYIVEKTPLRQNPTEELENTKKIRNFLIILNLSERVKILKNKGTYDDVTENLDKEIIDIINGFSDDIKNSINILKNEMLLL